LYLWQGVAATFAGLASNLWSSCLYLPDVYHYAQFVVNILNGE
jgi:hypothetical protein